MCRRWYLRAKAGDKSGKDLPRPGRQQVIRTLLNVCAVDEVVQWDKRATVRQISAETSLSRGSVHNILWQDLDLKKKAPKFVPRILTQDQKNLRVTVCRENLALTQDPLFLWTVVTGDESWFSVLEPEQKHKSCQWLSKEDK